jgi:hypothetical protein
LIGGAGKRSARMAVAALHPPVHVRQGSHPVACKAVVDRETTWKKCSIGLWRFRSGRLRPSSASCRVATMEDRGERIGIDRDHRVRLIRRPSLHVQWLPRPPRHGTGRREAAGRSERRALSQQPARTGCGRSGRKDHRIHSDLRDTTHTRGAARPASEVLEYRICRIQRRHSEPSAPLAGSQD